MKKLTAILASLLLLHTALPVHAADCRYGDVDGNAQINAGDAAIILTESARIGAGMPGLFTEAQNTAADLDGNGSVNAGDAASLLTYSACTGAGSPRTIDDFIYQLRLPVRPSKIPAFAGEPYTVINDGRPFFQVSDYDCSASFEVYNEMDSLGRCKLAVANLGQDLMPTEPRGEIGMIKPSGWHTVRYDGLVDGNYLYNRCHMIAFMLAGENANDRNLITGTRYMNVDGMLPFENQVCDYVKRTGQHVLYRVTPVFAGDDLVAGGVLMEAYSLEDFGTGICFNVYCYNVQPGVVIDYLTGESSLAEGAETTPSTTAEPVSTTAPVTAGPVSTTQTTVTTTATTGGTVTTSTTTTTTTVTVGFIVDPDHITYVANKNTKKFHLPGCISVSTISDKNRQECSNSYEDLLAMGYEPCQRCLG